MILSITSSERFMPDSVSVATTICFTYTKKFVIKRNFQKNMPEEYRAKILREQTNAKHHLKIKTLNYFKYHAWCSGYCS